MNYVTNALERIRNGTRLRNEDAENIPDNKIVRSSSVSKLEKNTEKQPIMREMLMMRGSSSTTRLLGYKRRM
mgnify:CR=1 FL=1